MKNIYYVLRHGNSLANRDGIILSDPDKGIPGYGLTKAGRDDIKQSINTLMESVELATPVNLISSPFKRTKESAEIASELLNIDDITFNYDLRERFFGDLDGTSNENYKKVWVEDAINPDHNTFNVESVNNVYKRATAIIDELENSYRDRTFILVTHGDTAQILECYFKGIDPKEHRTLKLLKQSEYRLLS